MKTKSGLAFECAATNNEDILNLDNLLRKIIQG